MATGTNINGCDIAPTLRGVDWYAVLLASVAAAVISYVLLLLFVPWAVGAGNAASVMRYLASVLTGPEVLAPPSTFAPGIALTSIAVHLVMSFWMTATIAFVLHRWGLLTGVLGGAFFGLLFFAIHFYLLTLFLPHMFAMSHWSVAVVHMVFGAVAGGIYEIFEFEPGESQAVRGS